MNLIPQDFGQAIDVFLAKGEDIDTAIKHAQEKYRALYLRWEAGCLRVDPDQHVKENLLV